MNFHAVLLTLALLLSSCASNRQFQNPSFDLDAKTARVEIARMKSEPVTLERPVLILGGFLDLGMGPRVLTRKFGRAVTNPELILGIGFNGEWSLDECRQRVLRRVEARFPSPYENQTVEFDVIGLSMGGLVAQLAALESNDDARKLRIHRLFTIATPHRGALRAERNPVLFKLQLEMRSNSKTIARIAGSDPDFEIFPYCRLGDRTVGESNAAPSGEVPWWLPTGKLQPNHKWAFFDSRIVAELISRLRGEGGFSKNPRAPLPPTKPKP